MKMLLNVWLLVSISFFATPLSSAETTITPDVVYGHKHGMALTLDVYQPAGDANGAGVLFMVSGGWYSRWSPPQQSLERFMPLLDKGFTVFAVRHGSSPKYMIPEVVSDVRRSVRFVRLNAKRFGVDPNRLGVFGGSAGGHLSLMLGTTADTGDPQARDHVLRPSNRVRAVVAYYPPTDLRNWLTDKSPYYREYPALQFGVDKGTEYSPILQVSPDDAPTLLVHGDEDKLVPIDHSEKILAEFEKKKVDSRLVVIEGAAHGFGGKHRELAQNALVAWFEKYLLDE